MGAAKGLWGAGHSLCCPCPQGTAYPWKSTACCATPWGGFCVFNDFAVAARTLQLDHAAAGGREPLPIAIIDLDVHQGNGTAHIFQGDASVFTLSLHGDKNFPFRKEASTLDLGLPDGTNDADYLQTLEHALQTLEGRFAPALLLYLAGADPARRRPPGAPEAQL